MSNTLETTPLNIDWHKEFSYPINTGEVPESVVKEAVNAYLSEDAPITKDVRNLKEHAILDSSYPNT